MKTHFNNRQTLILLLIFTAMPLAQAQVKSLGQMMAAGTEDAQKLFQAYLAPYVNGFGAAISGGWYNTAEAHKPGGFEITLTTNVAMVPDEFTEFNINTIGLQSLKPAPGADNIAPTVAGPSDDGPQLNYAIPGFPAIELKAFDMPQGLDWRYVPAPTIQAGVGLYKGTDLMGRYLPNIKAGGAEFGLWGIGGRHDIKQWIPGVKKLPVLQLSLMYGYTRLHANVGLSVTPSNIHAQDATSGIVNWEDQKLTLLTISHTANLLIAAKLPVITFYGGAGFIRTKSTLNLKGYYPVPDFGGYTGTDLSVTNASVALDPASMVFENKDGDLMKPRLNIGFRLKMSVVTLNFDYTRAIYNVFTAGLGVSWR
jgi:hypothetical protein